MPRYTARHAPRHAARRGVRVPPTRPYGARPTGARHGSGGGRAVDRSPGGVVSGGTASADTLTFAVDGIASSTSTEQSKTEQADAVRVAADRSATNAQRSVAAARSAQRDKVKAAALAKARKAAAEKAAAAAARKRVIDNAQQGPQGRDPRADARVRLRPGPVVLPRAPVDRRERLELQGREPLLGRLRHPAVLPGRKMATVAGDWRTPGHPDQWGLDYIKARTAPRATPSDQWNSPLAALVLTGPAAASPHAAGRVRSCAAGCRSRRGRRLWSAPASPGRASAARSRPGSAR